MNETKKNKKKRKRGEGRVEKLPSGSVRLKVPVVDVDGKKCEKSFTGKTLKKAEEKRDAYLAALEEAKDEGEFYFKRFEDAINIWLYEKKVVQISEASFKRLKSTFVVNVFPQIGGCILNQIDSSQLQNLINDRLSDLSYSSVKKIYDGLNNFYKWAVIQRKLSYNRMMGVELPKEKFFSIKTKEIDIIPDQAIEKLVEVALGRYMNGALKYKSGPAIVLLLLTGLRLGELLALEWTDVDFSNKTIKVWKTIIEKSLDPKDSTLTKEERILLERGRKSVFKVQCQPKSVASNRTIKINEKALEMLNILQKGNGKYVLETRKGDFRHPANFERTFKIILAQAGIPEMGVHCTRHTFATKMIRTKKVPLRVISRILGHANEKVTRDTYIHVCPNELNEAFEVVEELYCF